MKSVIGALFVSPLWFLIRVDVSNAGNMVKPFAYNSVNCILKPQNSLPFSSFISEHNLAPNSLDKTVTGYGGSEHSRRIRSSLQENQVAQDRFNPSTFSHLKHLKAAAHNAIKQVLPHEPSPESFFASGQFQVDDSIGAETGNIFLSEPPDGQFVNIGASGNQFVNDEAPSQTLNQFNGGASSNQFSTNQYADGGVPSNQHGTQNQFVSSNFIDDQYDDALQQPSQLVPENASRTPLNDGYPPPRPGSSYLPPPADPKPSFHTPEESFPPYIPPATNYVPPPPSPAENGSVPPKTYLPPPPTPRPLASVGYAYPVPLPPKPAPSTAAPLYLPPKPVAYVYNPPRQEGYSYNPPPPPPPPSPLPGPAYVYLPPPQPQPRPQPALPPPAPLPTPAEEEEDEREAQYYYYGVGRHLWYVPLYFSIYFIIYVGYLILRSIARHKVQLPAMLHEAAAAGARFDHDDFLVDVFGNLAVEIFKFHNNKK